ncbi:MAG: sugar transferase [Nitrospirae bacterium]|nr:sugar transferase [Nitrospirota bacterium]
MYGSVRPDIEASSNQCSPPVDRSTVSVVRNERVPFVLRVFEVSVAGAVLLFGLPVMLIQWAIIRLGTPGPGVFFQQRVGVGQRLFRFVKFRTMYVDARERFPQLYAYRYSPDELLALKFKNDNDPRVTSPALRKYLAVGGWDSTRRWISMCRMSGIVRFCSTSGSWRERSL